MIYHGEGYTPQNFWHESQNWGFCATIQIITPMSRARTMLLISDNNTHTTTVLRPFVRDYPGELVPEETEIFYGVQFVYL